MNILQSIIAFKPSTFGGIKNQLYYQAREMVKQGHFVEICTTNAYDINRNNQQRGTKYIEGIKVTYFRRIFPYSIYFIPMLMLYLTKNIHKFDIVHLQDFRTFPNIIVYLFAKWHRVPYLLSAHGSVPVERNAKAFKKNIFDKILGKRMLLNASMLIALSEIEKKQYLKVGMSKNKIKIIPNGVDPEDMPKSIKKGDFKEKYKVCNKKIISFVGRIHNIKGLDSLVKSFSILVKQEPLSVLVLAGGDHGCLDELSNLIDRLNIRNSVIFTGYLSGIDKWQLYLDSDVFVLPSKQEAFPNVIPEAAYYQTPIVLSDGCAIAKTVSENKFGIVIPYGDYEKLAEVLLKILRDDQLRKDMGRRGKEFVVKNWTWGKITNIILSTYSNVLKGKRN